MTTQRFLKNAELLWEDGEFDDAFQQLLLAVETLSQREQIKSAYMNRMVAENMFAIVRLEIANGTEQIINNALSVKRKQTGSGKVEFAFNIIGTLAMLAGNVLSGGGMGLLGNIIVAAGETLKAGAKNDVEGTVMGALKIGTTTASASVSQEGRDDFTKQVNKGFRFVHTDDVEGGKVESGKLSDAKVETQNTTEGVIRVVDDGTAAVKDIVTAAVSRFGGTKSADATAYKVEKRRTFFVKHGAGGTHAITVDVQEAVNAAYAKGLEQLNNELRTLNLDEAAAFSIDPNSILSGIVRASSSEISGLHPMTKWVLSEAASQLGRSGGEHYHELKGGSGAWGKTRNLINAKRDVKKAYAFMANQMESDGAIPPLDAVLEHVKT